MARARKSSRRATSLIPEEELPEVFRALVLQSPISTWIADKNGTQIFQNEACRQLLGIEKDEETVGRYNIFKDDELAAQGLMPQIKKVFDEGGSTDLTVDYDFSKVKHVKVSHPQHRILRWFLFAINDEEGRVRYVCVHHEDYTERVRAEEALRESEARYRSFVENFQGIAFQGELGFKPIFFHGAAEAITGYTEDEFTTGNPRWDQIVHPDDLPRVQKTGAPLRSVPNFSVEREYRILRKDGQTRWVHEMIQNVCDESGVPSFVQGVIYDVTERKRTEQELSESEERYRAVAQSAVDAIIIADSSGNIVSWNDAAQTMFGYAEAEVLGKPATLLMPERYEEAHRAALERTSAVGTHVTKMTGEFHGRRKDGSEFPLDISVSTWTTREGRFCSAIIRDVTERRRADEALRESEERYRQLVQMMNEGLGRADRNYMFTYVNETFSRMLGYAPEEMIGHHLLEFVHEDSRELMREQMKRRRRGEAGRFELAWRSKDGGKVYTLASPKGIFDEKGNFAGSVAVLTDITDRKVAEERRQELEEHKRDFYRRTILAATEGKLTICEPEEIERVAGLPITSWDIVRGEDVGAIRNAVGEIARSRGMDKSRIYDLALSVGETATNAFKHAGGGTASLHEVPDGLLFVVSDHGPGIEALTLPEVALVRGYSTAGSLGMGYKAIISFADKVYLATGPSGTTVAIEMKLHPQEKPPGAVALPETWTSSQ